MLDLRSSPSRDIVEANDLMVAALVKLDEAKHPAAAKLDAAIVELGIRPDSEGMPPGI